MNTTITATTAAFQIAMDRAFENGMTPDQFTQMMMTDEGKRNFSKLVDSCKEYLETK